ncbi:MAG TPA: pseudouridylate synthase [Bacteroidales bacterium]|jgi:predicted hotdog family 3-hydroxylacyl-ACP dehydratase|nr:pseudouridylate synthase [Bacteroidales bacterium]HQB19154.1 pseudouridylate synthase [Bacteroidales bacterium]
MKNISIIDIIPQRPPFVMIDTLLYADKEKARSTFYIQPDNLFVENGFFLEAGIIENIAQTCAAQIGYTNREEAIKIGVLGSVKDLKIYQLPLPHQTIETNIDITNVIFETTVIVDAKVMCQDNLIASCEMKVSITEKTIN